MSAGQEEPAGEDTAPFEALRLVGVEALFVVENPAIAQGCRRDQRVDRPPAVGEEEIGRLAAKERPQTPGGLQRARLGRRVEQAHGDFGGIRGEA